jgi:hypothetical protein
VRGLAEEDTCNSCLVDAWLVAAGLSPSLDAVVKFLPSPARSPTRRTKVPPNRFLHEIPTPLRARHPHCTGRRRRSRRA